MSTGIIDLCGRFWTEVYSSPVPPAYADGVGLVLAGVALPGETRGGPFRPFAISTADRDTSTAGLFRYPSPPSFTPDVILSAAGPTGVPLLRGADFSASGGFVSFTSDPFGRPEVRALAVTTGGVSEAVLWGMGTAAAPPAVVPQPSSYEALVRAVAAGCDAPYFTAGGTVAVVEEQGDGTWVVATETDAYRLPDGTVPAANVGDAVSALDPVTTAWRLVRLGPGSPAESRVAVPTHRLVGGPTGTVVWHNTPTATVVDTVSSKTRIRWALGGAGGDVTAFWAAVHARAVAGNGSLAEALDYRPNPSGQPTAADLPVSVNPADFLCRNVCRGMAFMVITDSSAFGPAAKSAADRRTDYAVACGPHAAAFEFDGGVPDTPAVLP